MKAIKTIFVDKQGYIYAEKPIHKSYLTEPKVPIEEIEKNGEMAPVPWYKQGNVEYNGKYVVKIEYYD